MNKKTKLELVQYNYKNLFVQVMWNKSGLSENQDLGFLYLILGYKILIRLLNFSYKT
jgi:hypothetical protein